MEFVEKEEDLSGEEQHLPNPTISAQTIPDFSRLERVLATMMSKVVSQHVGCVYISPNI